MLFFLRILQNKMVGLVEALKFDLLLSDQSADETFYNATVESRLLDLRILVHLEGYAGRKCGIG